MFNIFTFTKTVTNPSKLDRDITSNNVFGSAYQYLNIKGNQVTIHFTRNLIQTEIDALSSFISAFSDFSIYDNLYTYLGKDIDPFVDRFLRKMRAENIEMGISQSGKTPDVLSFFEDRIPIPGRTRPVSLMVTMMTSSLTATVQVLDYYISNPSLYSDLSPYITESRLTSWKDEIIDFLS